MAGITPREMGDQLGLSQLDIVHRIRRGQIRAKKIEGGWYWTIKPEEVERVRNTQWYKRLMRLRAQRVT